MPVSENFRSSSGSRHSPEARKKRGKDDGVVGPPTGSRGYGTKIADRHRRPAGNGHPLELPVGKEADGETVGRKEGGLRALCAGNRFGLELIECTKVELRPASSRTGRVNEKLAVRRKSHRWREFRLRRYLLTGWKGDGEADNRRRRQTYRAQQAPQRGAGKDQAEYNHADGAPLLPLRRCRHGRRRDWRSGSCFLDLYSGVRDVMDSSMGIFLQTSPQQTANENGCCMRQALPVRISF